MRKKQTRQQQKNPTDHYLNRLVSRSLSGHTYSGSVLKIDFQATTCSNLTDGLESWGNTDHMASGPVCHRSKPSGKPELVQFCPLVLILEHNPNIFRILPTVLKEASQVSLSVQSFLERGKKRRGARADLF